jgi:hypothetical protein
MSNQKILAQGLTTRPLAATLRGVLDWYKRQPANEQLSLITGFRKNAEGEWSENRTSWGEYLAREQELIRALNRRAAERSD